MEITSGTEIDGFVVGDRLHAGAQGQIFRVHAPDRGFPIVMKVPRLGRGEPSESLVSFETKALILSALAGPYVPRFVATGNLSKIPYLVLEWIDGETLDHLLARGVLPPDEVARIGALIADAVHDLHLQDTIHLDLKPDNILLRTTGRAALIDFGLAHHANLPDLLAEESRHAAGSAPYVSPEQLLGTRSDPRSDIFALGVVLYEMATGKLPFGVPATLAGLRDRLWLDPIPPRSHAPDIPPWLQEIILRCLEPRADDRYFSVAHLAFDLRHAPQVQLTARAAKSGRAGFVVQASRWWRARKLGLAIGRRAGARVRTTPVYMVAVDTTHPDDPRQPVLQRMTSELLSLSPEYRLICVSVVGSASVTESASNVNLEHLMRLRQWIEPLRLPPWRLSLHVIEAMRPAGALIDFAHSNHVDMILIGAPSPAQEALAWWRSVASSVTASARCSVMVVRLPAPESDYGEGAVPDPAAAAGPRRAGE